MNRNLVIVIAILICIPALLPFFRSNFFHLHDWTHVARLSEMDQAFQDGHFPVRWSSNLGFGYGMPQFNFYAPLFYYAALLIHWLGFSYLWSIKILVMINFFVSFIAMYYIVKPLWGTQAAIIAATAFIYAPYRAVDTYVRGSFAELTAITFVALVLLGITYWLRRPSAKKIALTSLAVGGLLLSHSLVAFIALPVLAVVAIVATLFILPRVKALLSVLAAFGLGVGVASFYVLPAFFEKAFTQVDNITTGFSDYHHHFLYLRQFFQNNWGYGGSIFGVEDNISFSLGWLSIILASVGTLGWLIIKPVRSRWTNLMIVISGAVIVFSMLMSTFKTQWLWDAITLMKYIQFPWRYLSIIIVFLSLLVGTAAFWLKRYSNYYSWGATGLIVGAFIILNLSYFKPEAYLDDNEILYYSDQIRIQSEMSSIIPDFLPKNTDPKRIQPPSQLLTLNPPAKNLDITIDRTHSFIAKVTLERPTLLTANINYFPGWKIYLDGKALATEANESGLIQAHIPVTGEITISGLFEETPLRKMANVISFLSLVICSYLLIPLISKRASTDYVKHR